MTTSLHVVRVTGSAGGQRPVRSVVLDERNQQTGDVVMIRWGTWCRSHSVIWSPNSVFDEPKDQQYVPRVGDVLVVERDVQAPTVATKWAYASDFHLLGRNPHATTYRFRLVNTKDGQIQDVVWELDPESETPTWEQVLDLSARWPRQTYEICRIGDPMESISGLLLQILFHDAWCVCKDIRAPLAAERIAH